MKMICSILLLLSLTSCVSGVENPETQDEQFTGRVRWDKDVLRDGRIRLHMSRLWFGDSGVYRCDVQTDDGRGSGICHLKVTAADEPKPPRWGWNILSVVLIALLVLCAGLCAGLCIAFIHRRTRRPIRGNNERDVQPI